MFRIKQEATNLKPDLDKRNRSPIALSMGAPTQNVPAFVVEKLKEAMQIDGIHLYSSPKGELFYREAISKRMKDRFNVDMHPEDEISAVIGSKEGIANMFRMLINPKDEEKEKDIILIPNPGYASYGEMIKSLGGVGFSVPLIKENNYMPNLDEVVKTLEQKRYNPSNIKALVINYPNNPLGVNCNYEYLQKTVEFCKKHNILLISDAAYCDIYFEENEKPRSIFEVAGAKDVAVEFFSFSKPYAMTGWRLGWVCGNKEVITMFNKLKTTIDTGIFKALQYAGSKVLNSQEGEAYIKESNKNFKRKQEIMVSGFKELGWNFSDTAIPKTTFYLWLEIPKRYKSSEEFTRDVLHKSGVLLVPGSAFGTLGEGYFRISNVASDEKLKEVISRLKSDGFYFA